MMRVEAPWLTEVGAQKVCRLLGDAGHRALFVGGCVRNAILGSDATDVDIATDALPQAVLELAEAAGLKAVPTGIDHGTVTLVVNGSGYEVTTFRRDVETDGRRAVIAFSSDILEDARRRDFTMNALYADAAGTLIDPLGGLDDTRAHRVRFIDDAAQRIREDYLRILRFFRFHAWYGADDAGLDADGLAACAALQEGLAQISVERITAEMLKLLAAPNPSVAVAAMAQSGILARVLPGAEHKALGPLVHFEAEADLKPDPILRLVALAPAPELRLSKAQQRRVEHLSRHARETDDPAVQGFRLGSDDGAKAYLLRSALVDAVPTSEGLAAVARGAQAVFPVEAADLAGRYEGAALGQALRTAEERWLASGMTLQKEDLLKS